MEANLKQREERAAVAYELEKEKHVLRQMQGWGHKYLIYIHFQYFILFHYCVFCMSQHHWKSVFYCCGSNVVFIKLQ